MSSSWVNRLNQQTAGELILSINPTRVKRIIPIKHIVGCVYHYYNPTTLLRSLIAGHGRAHTVYKSAGNPHLGCELAGNSRKLSANQV